MMANYLNGIDFLLNLVEVVFITIINLFSESSHFAMIAISIFLTNFYLIIEKNFKDIKLIISFVIFSFVVFNNISLLI